LVGQHAFLGASKYHWINYDDEKIIQSYLSALAVERGTKLHDFACQAIQLKIKLPAVKKTLNMYVNDVIKNGLTPEQPLYFSRNCFGTADAIGFDEQKKFLQIFDLKTGVTPAHMEQLQIYAALFCLEYHKRPEMIGMELRLYQNDEIRLCLPDSSDIARIMTTIIRFDDKIEKIKLEE
jgi:hypothetical protein